MSRMLAGCTFYLSLALAFAGPAHAQTATPASTTPQTAAPAYDVSSVKPSEPDATGMSSMFNGAGRYEGTNITMHELLQTAFGKRRDMILGLPAWADKTRFDVQAKSVETDEATLKALPQSARLGMLRKVLEDRFQLKWHMEQREMPTYELVVNKGGIKMSVSTVTGKGSGVRGGRNGELTGINCPMDVLAVVLSNPLQRAVVNKTGLTDKYNFTLKYTPDDAPAGSDAELPSLFTAIQEQLGLKLQPAKGLQEVLVIDSVSMPTAN